MKPCPLRAMTPLEQKRAVALSGLEFRPGTFVQRFALNVRAQAQTELTAITDRQATILEQLCWQFRRQLPSDLVPVRGTP